MLMSLKSRDTQMTATYKTTKQKHLLTKECFTVMEEKSLVSLIRPYKSYTHIPACCPGGMGIKGFCTRPQPWVRSQK